jgi:hypothetical protein
VLIALMKDAPVQGTVHASSMPLTLRVWDVLSWFLMDVIGFFLNAFIDESKSYAKSITDIIK